jgi:hypothetical protein
MAWMMVLRMALDCPLLKRICWARTGSTRADVLALALEELAGLAGHALQIDEVVCEVPALGGLVHRLAHPETMAVLTHHGEGQTPQPSGAETSPAV